MVALMIAGVFSFAVAAFSPSAHAATVTIDQCNGHGPAAEGASTGLTCSVTVVNTIRGTKTSSTTTVTRTCTLGPCSSPNGTFTSSSTDLVTSVSQCNGSDNDAAHPITCDVTITNNISSNTPQARPVTAATVNQCVGSGAGGGGTVNCNPFPAATTTATVTQCNGSANGGGATIACAVGTASTVSRAIPITVNQCNGTGNPGGSVVTCRTTLLTNITASTSTATASPSASPTPTARSTARSTSRSTPKATTRSTASTAQVSRVPGGGVQAGGGSTAGLQDVRLLVVGGGLLLAATIGVLFRRRLAHGPVRLPR
jgi:hypothetical protein